MSYFAERQSVDGMESVPGAVATGSQLTHDPGSQSRDPVATAPGTDLILKLGHYPLWTLLESFARILSFGESNVSESITYQTPPYGAAFAPGAISPLVEAAGT